MFPEIPKIIVGDEKDPSGLALKLGKREGFWRKYVDDVKSKLTANYMTKMNKSLKAENKELKEKLAATPTPVISAKAPLEDIEALKSELSKLSQLLAENDK